MQPVFRVLTIGTRRGAVACVGALLICGAVISFAPSIGQASGCSRATIAGAYGLTATGSFAAPGTPRAGVAFIGRTVYDGRGGLTGVQVSNVEGTATVEREPLSGSYDVRPDCTGVETFMFTPSGQMVNADFVIVADGRGILFVDTDPGVLLAVTATRQ